MSRITALVILILLGLAALQSYRAHHLGAQLDALTVSRAIPVEDCAHVVGSLLMGDQPSFLDGVDSTGDEDAPGATDEYVRAIDQRDQERDPTDQKTARNWVAPVGQPSDKGAAEKRSSESKSRESARAKQEKGGNEPVLNAQLKRQTQNLLNRAQEALKLGDYQEAIDRLTECLQTDPSRREAYSSLARLYRKLGMSQEAMEVYGDWMANRSQDAAPHYQLASLYESVGMDKEALDQLLQFQQMTQGDVDAYPMVASLYRQLGLRQEEGAALQAWVSDVPNSLDGHRMLAQYYARIGDKPGAIAEYEVLAQLAPENAVMHAGLAGAYQRAARYEDAAAELVTAMNLQPGNGGVRLQLAQVYRQMGDLQAALDTYANVIADAPNSPEAAQAQQGIARIQRQLQPPSSPKPAKPKS